MIVPNDVDPTTAAGNALYAPFKAKYKYHKLLPNIGGTYAINESLSVFAQLREGLVRAAHRQSVPCSRSST